jgi:hypothetical protein
VLDVQRGAGRGPQHVNPAVTRAGLTRMERVARKGLSVVVTTTRPGGALHALVGLRAADTVYPRTDVICWEPPPGAGDLVLLNGDPALPAAAPVLPAGAEMVGWIGIPAACVQITPAMIRCALPAELPANH